MLTKDLDVPRTFHVDVHIRNLRLLCSLALDHIRCMQSIPRLFRFNIEENIISKIILKSRSKDIEVILAIYMFLYQIQSE